jgi:hypothetical protein
MIKPEQPGSYQQSLIGAEDPTLAKKVIRAIRDGSLVWLDRFSGELALRLKMQHTIVA